MSCPGVNSKSKAMYVLSLSDIELEYRKAKSEGLDSIQRRSPKICLAAVSLDTGVSPGISRLKHTKNRQLAEGSISCWLVRWGKQIRTFNDEDKRRGFALHRQTRFKLALDA